MDATCPRRGLGRRRLPTKRDLLVRLAIVAGCILLALACKAAGAADAPAPKTVELYDWMHFNAQPDLRQRGWRPLFGAMDGTYNRATIPEANNTPEDVDQARSLFASRRQARAAIGIEPLGQDQWWTPAAYASAERPVIFDLEGVELLRQADQLRSTSRERIRLVDNLCASVDAMRYEAKCYGRKLQVAGYLPINWVARDTWPGDPAYRAYDKAGQEDWRPWTDRLDFVVPEASMSTEDVPAALKIVEQLVADCKRLAPGKPIVIEMQLCYAHGMPDSNPMKWKLVPLNTWTQYVRGVMAMPDVAGVCLFGPAVYGVPMDDAAGSEANGTLRTNFRHVDQHVRMVELLARGANVARSRPPAPTSQPTSQPAR